MIFRLWNLYQIINELNVFAISNREVERLVMSIKRAIDDLDTILISLEDLIYSYGEEDIFIFRTKSFQRLSY